VNWTPTVQLALGASGVPVQVSAPDLLKNHVSIPPPAPFATVTAETVTEAPPVFALLVNVTVPVPVMAPVGNVIVSRGVGEMLTASCTVNVTVLVFPLGVASRIVLGPTGAAAAMAKVAVTVVELTTVKLLTVMLAPKPVTPVAPVRFEPVKVTLTLVPCTPVLGATDVSAGAVAAAVTVNVTALLPPPDVVTVTFLPVVAAPAVTVQVALTVVAVELIPPQVTPAPDTVTAVAPVKLVPTKVTATVVLRAPEAGAIEVNVGVAAPGPVNSTAPASTALLVFLCVP
jgi:hypothetical protein